MLDPNKRKAHNLYSTPMLSAPSVKASRQNQISGGDLKPGDFYESPSNSSRSSRQYSSRPNASFNNPQAKTSGKKPMSFYSKPDQSTHSMPQKAPSLYSKLDRSMQNRSQKTPAMCQKSDQSAHAGPQKVQNLWLLGGLALLGVQLLRLRMNSGDGYDDSGFDSMMPDDFENGNFGPMMPDDFENRNFRPMMPDSGGGCPNGRCPR